MDHNYKIKCPNCDQEIKKLAHICIHCRVNIFQYKKDNPITNDLIDNSTQTVNTPSIPNKDLIQQIRYIRC